MRFMIMAAAVAALAFASTAEAKQCKDAKGHFTKCPAAAAAPASKPAAKAAPAMAAAPAKASKTSGAKAAPKCKTGVPCGGACIPKGKVCHK
jgi:hypothetical protein